MPDASSSIYPKNNTFLLGQEKAEKILLEAYRNNSMHNSWLFYGIEGIGKATLAYRFARFLLAADDHKKESYTSLEIAENNPVYKLVVNNAHPDLKIIERDYTDTDKRKILKAIKDGEALSDDELKGLKKSAVIKVDEVRTINEFLSKKSADNHWRVVIIDSIDDMNVASANAVLKILEEPPAKSILILISHNPGRLLPTIKSRCAKLQLAPLDDKIVASLLRRYRPELSEKEISGLTAISSGSIGKALVYADNKALQYYEDLCKIGCAKEKFKLSELLSFCDAAAKDESVYALVQELIFKFISDNIANSTHTEALADVWEKTLKIFDETERLNLDKKQVLVNIIYSIIKAV
ncbi:MAG: DNA polymerase III subunit delta' [Alphaproteobacteria bacterium]|nr:DNA polymerase III subunit delta' [Alphaproteobacteria bacterium]